MPCANQRAPFVNTGVTLLQLLDMRKMLTEVLLTVTSEEMEDVAREVYAKERAKASKGITSGRKITYRTTEPQYM